MSVDILESNYMTPVISSPVHDRFFIFDYTKYILTSTENIFTIDNYRLLMYSFVY